MVDFFSYIYNLTISKSKFLEKSRFNTFFRVIIRVTSNSIIPLYFILTRWKYNLEIRRDKSKSPKVIISLTSFPDRINRVWLVIETLLRQKYKPDLIILWLSKDQFESLDKLPKNLLKMQDRGLDIRLCDGDLRSHKKYYYAIKEFPDDIIITVDDDVFYNSNIILYLFKIHEKYPKSICCNLASQITYSIQGDVLPYLQWIDIKRQTTPATNIFPIGMGGVLYPPKSLHQEVLNSDVFKDICFMADDIWLNAMSHLQKTKAVKTDYNSLYLPVINPFSSTLADINVINGLNDKQIYKVKQYCKDLFSFDPYTLTK